MNYNKYRPDSEKLNKPKKPKVDKYAGKKHSHTKENARRVAQIQKGMIKVS